MQAEFGGEEQARERVGEVYIMLTEVISCVAEDRQWLSGLCMVHLF